jgi:hypothetical protein
MEMGFANVTITGSFVLGTRDREWSGVDINCRSGSVSNIDNSINVEFLASGTSTISKAIYIYKIVSGTWTLLDSVGTGSSFTKGTQYTFTITLDGNSISVSCNGLSKTTSTSDNASNTKHGFGVLHATDLGSGSVTYLDDFKVTK